MSQLHARRGFNAILCYQRAEILRKIKSLVTHRKGTVKYRKKIYLIVSRQNIKHNQFCLYLIKINKFNFLKKI